ncbi:hypothetical protein CYMTET_3302 [Cymbomonas tetramitiformis]|uniref:Uncharacterized protein n=1 Tax=Cymbomonas tetramitiformis TaxID=36881 RepID=A0AAE0H3J7_9CHLO|nr:hypothetical protein CYMTET_3302 [Cymbomonas tetramitiformis]|eukprot:gene20345-24368_t
MTDPLEHVGLDFAFSAGTPRELPLGTPDRSATMLRDGLASLANAAQARSALPNSMLCAPAICGSPNEYLTAVVAAHSTAPSVRSAITEGPSHGASLQLLGEDGGSEVALLNTPGVTRDEAYYSCHASPQSGGSQAPGFPPPLPSPHGAGNPPVGTHVAQLPGAEVTAQMPDFDEFEYDFPDPGEPFAGREPLSSATRAHDFDFMPGPSDVGRAGSPVAQPRPYVAPGPQRACSRGELGKGEAALLREEGGFGGPEGSLPPGRADPDDPNSLTLGEVAALLNERPAFGELFLGFARALRLMHADELRELCFSVLRGGPRSERSMGGAGDFNLSRDPGGGVRDPDLAPFTDLDDLGPGTPRDREGFHRGPPDRTGASPRGEAYRVSSASPLPEIPERPANPTPPRSLSSGDDGEIPDVAADANEEEFADEMRGAQGQYRLQQPLQPGPRLPLGHPHGAAEAEEDEFAAGAAFPRLTLARSSPVPSLPERPANPEPPEESSDGEGSEAGKADGAGEADDSQREQQELQEYLHRLARSGAPIGAMGWAAMDSPATVLSALQQPGPVVLPTGAVVLRDGVAPQRRAGTPGLGGSGGSDEEEEDLLGLDDLPGCGLSIPGRSSLDCEEDLGSPPPLSPPQSPSGGRRAECLPHLDDAAAALEDEWAQATAAVVRSAATDPAPEGVSRGAGARREDAGRATTGPDGSSAILPGDAAQLKAKAWTQANAALQATGGDEELQARSKSWTQRLQAQGSVCEPVDVLDGGDVLDAGTPYPQPAEGDEELQARSKSWTQRLQAHGSVCEPVDVLDGGDVLDASPPDLQAAGGGDQDLEARSKAWTQRLQAHGSVSKPQGGPGEGASGATCAQAGLGLWTVGDGKGGHMEGGLARAGIIKPKSGSAAGGEGTGTCLDVLVLPDPGAGVIRCAAGAADLKNQMLVEAARYDATLLDLPTGDAASRDLLPTHLSDDVEPDMHPAAAADGLTPAQLELPFSEAMNRTLREALQNVISGKSPEQPK